MKKSKKRTMSRRHAVLFVKNSPFKGRATRLRKRYTRKIKHRGKDEYNG